MTVERRARRATGGTLALALALAGGPAAAQGTQAQREACTADAWRLCAAHIPSVPAITQCLRREEARLSPACRTAMREAAAPRVVAAPRPAEAARPAARAARAAPEAHPAQAQDDRRHAAPRPRAAAAPARPVRVAARRPGSPVAVHRRVGHRLSARGPRIPGLGPMGGREMREARRWMARLGGLAELAGLGGMGGLDGSALAGLRGMRVGDLLDSVP